VGLHVELSDTLAASDAACNRARWRAQGAAAQGRPADDIATGTSDDLLSLEPKQAFDGSIPEHDLAVLVHDHDAIGRPFQHGDELFHGCCS
jgi:hypothetical protein